MAKPRVQSEIAVQIQDAVACAGFRQSELATRASVITIAVGCGERKAVNGTTQDDQHESRVGIRLGQCQTRRGRHRRTGTHAFQEIPSR